MNFQSDVTRISVEDLTIFRVQRTGHDHAVASGEPPASKGYTPSVFSELPRLLERAAEHLVDANRVEMRRLPFRHINRRRTTCARRFYAPGVEGRWRA